MGEHAATVGRDLPRDIHAEAAAMQIKTGAWRRDLAGLQQRRLEAAHMFACGATQAEVARTFAVSRQAASVWYRQWHHGGEPAQRGAGRTGRPPRLSAAELGAVDQALRLGPQAFGFDTQLWTLRRVAVVIERLVGVRFHPGHVWRLLRRLDWTVQRPARRALERDEAEIARWRAQEWPRIKGGRLSDRSFAQVAGAILRKQARGQNPDKDEVSGNSGRFG
jgi:transposase